MNVIDKIKFALMTRGLFPPKYVKGTIFYNRRVTKKNLDEIQTLFGDGKLTKVEFTHNDGHVSDLLDLIKPLEAKDAIIDDYPSINISH